MQSTLNTSLSCSCREGQIAGWETKEMSIKDRRLRKVEREASEESREGHKKVRLVVSGRAWSLLNPGFPKHANSPLSIIINSKNRLNKS